MKGEPKKHHYVPQFYMKKFADESGCLWVYDRKLKTYKLLPPKTLCSGEDFYSIGAKGTAKDRRIETNYLSKIDAMGASIIRELEDGNRFDGSRIRALTLFMAYQFTRTPTFRRGISSIYEATGEQLAKIAFANPERAAEVLQKYGGVSGEKSDVTPESMVEFAHGEDMIVKATEAPFLMHMVSHAEDIANALERSDCQVLMSPKGTGFITCDNPIVPVPPPDFNPGDGFGVGIAFPGAVRYYPVSRYLCVRLGQYDYGFRYRKVDARIVRTVNSNIAANSDRFIMGPSRTQVEDIAARSKSEDEDPGDRFSVEVLKDQQDHAFIKFGMKPRRYFFCEGS